MNISGLKDLVREAYESKKFLTNGQALPNIDFNEPVLVEVTGIRTSGLFSMIQIEDDTIVNCETAFTRELYLQMTHHCVFEDALVALLGECPATSTYLQDANKIRICITGFTAVGKKPFRKPVKHEDPNQEHFRRKLVPEIVHHIRSKDLVCAS